MSQFPNGFGMPSLNLPGMQQQLIRVKGIESARMYSMPVLSTVPLFDEDEDVLYIKSTDASGYPTIRVFNLVEVFEKPIQNDMSKYYVTIEEFEKFKEEILSNAKQFVQQQPANGKSKYAGTKQSDGNSETDGQTNK